MSSIISIPFQEKVTVRMRDGLSEGGVRSTTEMRVHPFLAGPENYVICSAVYDVIQEVPNPFVMIFCAPSGCGKSHLVEGLLISWLSRHSDGRGKCVSARDFAREWANAQRTRTTQEFFPNYLTLDFFVLENLQEIATYPATQELLVQLLDALGKRGARILLTVNQTLETLTFIPKLASRLKQGVLIEIQLPSVETRLEILRLPEHLGKTKLSEAELADFANRAAGEGLTVGDMILRFQKMKMIRKTADEKDAGGSSSVMNVFGKEEETSVTIAQIAKLAAKFYKVKLSDLRSKSRKTTLVTVRDVVYYMARRITGATLDEIGLYFNGRDHTTILHGCTQAELMIQNDEEVRRCVAFLYSELGRSQSARVD